MFTESLRIREMKTPYEILKDEADKNLIDISVIFPVLGLIRKAMRIYGMQEYMKGFEDGKKETDDNKCKF